MFYRYGCIFVQGGVRYNFDVVYGMEDEKMRDLEYERMGQYYFVMYIYIMYYW